MGYVSWKPNARGMSVARARIRPAMVCDGERLKLALGLLADGVSRERGARELPAGQGSLGLNSPGLALFLTSLP